MSEGSKHILISRLGKKTAKKVIQYLPNYFGTSIPFPHFYIEGKTIFADDISNEDAKIATSLCYGFYACGHWVKEEQKINKNNALKNNYDELSEVNIRKMTYEELMQTILRITNLCEVECQDFSGTCILSDNLADAIRNRQ